MNKRQRQEKAQRVSEHYQKAEAKQVRRRTSSLTRLLDEIYEYQVHDEYNIFESGRG